MKLIRFLDKTRRLHDMFLRFQEHYESPEFRGKYFTRSEFDEWYEQSRGTLYYEDWCGFNLPSHILQPFMHGHFDPLSADESYFLSCCNAESDGKPFYVIGAPAEAEVRTNRHEFAHALYYLSEEYKNIVDQELGRMTYDDHRRFKNRLIGMGYDESVIDDEIQAYVVCGTFFISKHSIKNNLDEAFDSIVQDLIIVDIDHNKG